MNTWKFFSSAGTTLAKALWIATVINLLTVSTSWAPPPSSTSPTPPSSASPVPSQPAIQPGQLLRPEHLLRLRPEIAPVIPSQPETPMTTTPAKPRRPVIPLLPAEQQEIAKELEKGGTGPIRTDVAPGAAPQTVPTVPTPEPPDVAQTVPTPDPGEPPEVVVDRGDGRAGPQAACLRAIKLLELMGFRQEAGRLRDLLNKREIGVGPVPGDSLATTSIVTGIITVSPQVVTRGIADVAEKLLHELFHRENQTRGLGAAIRSGLSPDEKEQYEQDAQQGADLPFQNASRALAARGEFGPLVQQAENSVVVAPAPVTPPSQVPHAPPEPPRHTSPSALPPQH